MAAATSSPRSSALLVMAHGSPDQTANSDLHRIVVEIQARGLFALVKAAFLECNEPSIPDAIDACVAAGAREIIGVPYFLHTGKHVAEDLPGIFEEGQIRHPSVRFKLGGYLGCSSQLTDILADRIKAIE